MLNTANEARASQPRDRSIGGRRGFVQWLPKRREPLSVVEPSADLAHDVFAWRDPVREKRAQEGVAIDVPVVLAAPLRRCALSPRLACSRRVRPTSASPTIRRLHASRGCSSAPRGASDSMCPPPVGSQSSGACERSPALRADQLTVSCFFNALSCLIVFRHLTPPVDERFELSAQCTRS